VTTLRIVLLGPPQIFRVGELVNHNFSQKALGLLAYLVMSPLRGYSREVLSGMFWGETNDKNANFNLRRAFWSLRKSINPPGAPAGTYLHYKDGHYSFNGASDYWCDATLFEHITALGSDLNAKKGMLLPSKLQRSASPDSGALREIVQLYRGDFLDGYRLNDSPVFEDWLSFERQRLKQHYIDCLRQLAIADAAQQEYHQAITDYQAILKVDPLDEPTHRDLMVVYYSLGMRDKALEQYYDMQQLLLQQLKLEPLPETQALFSDIRDNTLTLEGTSYKLATTHKSIASAIPSGPFIGRKREQKLLFDALETANQSTGYMAVISGEAGVGKTRLVEEFLYQLSANPCTILRGRCYLQEQGLPFQPIIDALRTFLYIADFVYIKSLSNLWLAEVAKLLPEIYGYLPHIPINSALFPDQERNRLFEGIAQLFAHLSQREPVILFLDDLDAADVPTLELIHYLARRLAAARVLIIGTIRKEALADHTSLTTLLQELTQNSRSTTIPLARLSEAEVLELIDQTSGTSDTVNVLGRHLYQDTGGNPFFLMEMLKARKGWQGSPPASSIVPSNLRNVIDNRLKHLDDESRRVVIMAAVIGRQFGLSTLQKIYSGDNQYLLSILEQLIFQGWIEEIPGADPGRYDFSHGLVRDSVYQSLSAARRQRLHHRVALALEATYGENNEFAGVLAYHFGKSADTNKALHYAMQAASHARRLYAFHEAVTYYHQVLDIVEHSSNILTTEEALSIKCQLGQSYEFIGQYDTAIAVYHAALPRIDFSHASHRHLGFQMASAYDHKGHYEKALEIFKAIGEQLSKPEDNQSRIEAARNARGIASVYSHREQSHQALAFCKHALAIIGDEDVAHPTLSLAEPNVEERVFVNEIMADSYFNLGNYEESVNHYLKALKIAEIHDQRSLVAGLLIGLGGVARRRGQYTQAIEYAQRSLGVCRKIGHISGEAAAQGLQGDVAYNRGDFGRAISCYEEALSTYRQIGDQHGTADSCISLGFVKIDQEEIDVAENYLLEALALGQTLDSALVLIRAQYHLARVALARGQLEQAQATAEHALKASHHTGIRLLEAAVHHQLGVILTQRLQFTQGEIHILKSLRLYESLGDTFETAWVIRSHAQLLADRGDLSHAFAELQRAIELFSGLGAERELTKTNQILKELRKRKK
jgi:DNA-binding SARP family transcriptional activator